MADMSLRDDELARRMPGGVEIRSRPLRVQWFFCGLAAADAHTLNCRFSCSVRVGEHPADRRMLEEILLASKQAVTVQHVVEHFSSTLKTALKTLVGKYNAFDLTSGKHHQDLTSGLISSASSLAFSCGLEFLPPYQLELESPTLELQRMQEMARSRTAWQIEHAIDLFRRFQQLRESAPELPAGKLLEQISPQDSGFTLQTLLLAASAGSRDLPLWAVSGHMLVKLDPRSNPPKTQLIDLPDSLGPARSVRVTCIDGHRTLLIGARSGVIMLDPDYPGVLRLYAMPARNFQRGFNSVVCAGDRIWAAHGEAGVVCWKIDRSESPVFVHEESAGGAAQAEIRVRSASGIMPTADVAGPGNLHLLNQSHLIYSLGGVLVVRGPEERHELPVHSSSDIVSIVPTPRTMVAVHRDGTLVVVDRASIQVVRVLHRGTILTAAAAMPWLDDVRLLLAGQSGPIDCIGLDDSMVSQYASKHRGFRMLAACADMIAAVCSDRQRVVFWHSWQPDGPVCQVHLSAQTGHRVADAAFG